MNLSVDPCPASHLFYSSSGPPEPQSLRLLVAEDDKVNQKVAKMILEHAGFAVDLVNDGSQAVEAHRSAPYRVILMDCAMPVMDGFEATRQIRSLRLIQPIIIAVTACAMAGDREKCLKAEMNDYLSKPFTRNELLFAVRRAVQAALFSLPGASVPSTG